MQTQAKVLTTILTIMLMATPAFASESIGGGSINSSSSEVYSEIPDYLTPQERILFIRDMIEYKKMMGEEVAPTQTATTPAETQEEAPVIVAQAEPAPVPVVYNKPVLAKAGPTESLLIALIAALGFGVFFRTQRV